MSPKTASGRDEVVLRALCEKGPSPICRGPILWSNGSLYFPPPGKLAVKVQRVDGCYPEVQIVAKLFLFYKTFSWDPCADTQMTQRKTKHDLLIWTSRIYMSDSQGLRHLK